MRKMFSIALDLMKNPGAETKAEPWLTRYFAHKGLGNPLFTYPLLAAMFQPWWDPVLTAAIAGSIIYALVEIFEMFWVKRFRDLILDCIADWIATVSVIWGFYFAWNNDLQGMLASLTVALVIAYFGVRNRI